MAVEPCLFNKWRGLRSLLIWTYSLLQLLQSSTLSSGFCSRQTSAACQLFTCQPALSAASVSLLSTRGVSATTRVDYSTDHRYSYLAVLSWSLFFHQWRQSCKRGFPLHIRLNNQYAIPYPPAEGDPLSGSLPSSLFPVGIGAEPTLRRSMALSKGRERKELNACMRSSLCAWQDPILLLGGK